MRALTSRVLPLLSVAALTLGAGGSTAAAGSYLSLGLGGEPALQGDLEVAASGEQGGNGRLALGQRFGRVAIEGSLSRFGLADAGDSANVLGIHARMAFPLRGKLEAYGRVGVEKLWLGDTQMAVSGDASGLVGAAGLEFRLTAPVLGSASIWAELSQDRFTTEDGAEGGVRLWTLGASLGL